MQIYEIPVIKNKKKYKGGGWALGKTRTPQVLSHADDGRRTPDKRRSQQLTLSKPQVS